MSETQQILEDDPADALIDAALPLVAFDGFTLQTLMQAADTIGMAQADARALMPRGGVDLALAFHRRADQQLAAWLETADLTHLRYSEKVAEAIWQRMHLIAPWREEVRRAAALFALPQHAADGSRAIWETADTIWTGLGDTSDDINWYTKRMTLSAVQASVVLYWLGDQSEGQVATRDFIDRRIADVMRVERLKASVRDSPLGRAFAAGPGRLFESVRAPRPAPEDLPGRA
ncbi:COQ9 family protein [Halovulum sp. GXIMD14793]